MNFIARKLRTAGNQPLAVILWLLPVWCALGVFRLAILLLPLRFMARFYGRDAALTEAPPPLTAPQMLRARQAMRTISIAARYTPWRSSCYPQALAAHMLLSFSRVAHVIYFGLRKAAPQEGAYAAHAWVMAGDVPVSGGAGRKSFTIVRAFANSGR